MHFASPALHAYLSPGLIVAALFLTPVALIVGALVLPVGIFALVRRALRKNHHAV